VIHFPTRFNTFISFKFYLTIKKKTLVFVDSDLNAAGIRGCGVGQDSFWKSEDFREKV
jgi:hypothetical protein